MIRFKRLVVKRTWRLKYRSRSLTIDTRSRPIGVNVSSMRLHDGLPSLDRRISSVEFLVRKVQLLKSSTGSYSSSHGWTCSIYMGRDSSSWFVVKLSFTLYYFGRGSLAITIWRTFAVIESSLENLLDILFIALSSRRGTLQEPKCEHTPLVAGLYAEFLTRSVVDPGGARMKIEANTANTVNVAAPW